MCKINDSEKSNFELINNMINGYALHEIICNSNGEPVDYRFLKVNKAFETMLNLKAETVIGKTVLEILPSIEPDWIEKYCNVAITGISTSFEAFNINLSKHFQVTAYCPKPNQFACFFIDISDRKAKEKELYESEMKYRKIFESAPDGVFVLDKSGRYLSVNNASEKITGYTADELLSMSIFQMYPEESSKPSQEHFAKVKEKGSASSEMMFLHKDGSKRWWSVDTNQLSKTKFISFTKDITDRKSAEKALEKRMLSLISPIDNASEITFDEIFNIVDIQRIQDEFSDATNVASIITAPDGTPITEPSNFCYICSLIRKTDPGHTACSRLYSTLTCKSKNSPTISQCFNTGFWEAGAQITVGGKHIANWVIGQVKKETQSDTKVREYARKIGLDEELIAKVFMEVPVTPRSDFEKTSKMLFTFANQLSTFAYQNVQQARFITELKQTKASLKESEEHFASLFQDAPLAYQSLDINGNIVNVNNAWLDTFGYKRDEIIGTWVGNLLNKDLVESFRKQFPCFKKTGKVQTEFIMMHKNGESKFIEVNGRIKHNPDGSFNRTHCILNDITERKKAERELANEKELLSVTLSSIADGVITTDTNGSIVMLNTAAEDLTGWTFNDAKGKPFHEVFNIMDRVSGEACDNIVSQVLAANKLIRILNNICMTSKDGRKIIIAKSAAPMHDSEGKVIGVVIVFRDMTEKQELDNSIQRAQKLESIGMLAGGIAHDFNNILSGVFGYVELALGLTKEEEVSNYLSSSLSNIGRAKALTQQLLTFAKGGVPKKKVENLFPFTKKTVEFALSGSSVLSKFHIQSDLWACNFDKNQIGQVIDNLTINAQQAMPNGGEIEIFAENISVLEREHTSLTAGNYVKLSIKDQGTGVPKEFLPQIFDPYFTTKSKGHGLGLSTCYSILNRHGGYIDVESEPGKGSCFHIYLPATTKEVSNIAKKSSKNHSGSGTFLVMDDEESILKVMKAMLKSFGYNVVLKKNGEEAIEFFMKEYNAKRKIAGMIFDITIPGGMGGKDAISEIRKVCSKTPAFVASGYSQDPIIANPENFGFIASICKPFTMSDLSKMLDKHLVKH